MAGALRAAAAGLLKAAAALLLAPFALAVALALLALWLVTTVTGVGPLAHYLCSRADRKLLQSTLEPAPGAAVRLLPVSGGRHRLAVRWSPGDGSRPYPVCIPNGLGATLITISQLHERLAAMGFAVLSYDRAGVGLSDARSPPPGADKGHAGAEEVVAEMKEVMAACAPGARWLLVGPSMGNIVAQCFIAAHPSAAAGLLNVDGFPFPFAAKRRRFELAGGLYAFASLLSRTGYMRPLLWAARGQLSGLASGAFPEAVVRAQMNEARFFSSLAAEMLTMMDCADAARAAWGPAFDLVEAPEAALRALGNAAPAACGDAEFPAAAGGGGDGNGGDGNGGDGNGGDGNGGDGNRGGAAWEWRDLPRAAAEAGAEWTPEAEVRAAFVNPMLGAHAKAAGADGAAPPPLPGAWRRLAVRAVSGRNYSKMGAAAEAFYDKQMQAWAAAEHALLVLLAARGARTVFPERHHGQMLLGLEPFVAAEVAALQEDAAAVAARVPTP